MTGEGQCEPAHTSTHQRFNPNLPPPWFLATLLTVTLLLHGRALVTHAPGKGVAAGRVQVVETGLHR